MKKILIYIFGIIILSAYPLYGVLRALYVDRIVNVTPRPMSMYRIVTSSKEDWTPSKRIFVQGYFSSSSGSESTLWVSEEDAKLSIMGAGIDILDNRIITKGCFGKYVLFVGMIGIPPGEKRVTLYETEQIHVIGADFPKSHMSPEALEYSASLNCYLDVGTSGEYLTKYGIRKWKTNMKVKKE